METFIQLLFFVLLIFDLLLLIYLWRGDQAHHEFLSSEIWSWLGRSGGAPAAPNAGPPVPDRPVPGQVHPYEWHSTLPENFLGTPFPMENLMMQDQVMKNILANRDENWTRLRNIVERRDASLKHYQQWKYNWKRFLPLILAAHCLVAGMAIFRDKNQNRQTAGPEPRGTALPGK
jgi:hypothetical protein